MTFLLLLIPSLPATPTFWTFRRVSSIKYPSIYHNPPPSTPPPPNAPSDFTTLRITGTSIPPWAQTMCRKKVFVQVYIFWVPTLLLLSPLCTLLQLSAGPPSSPFLPLFYLSFPVAFILARTGSQAEPFLDHIWSFRDCLIATSTLRILL